MYIDKRVLILLSFAAGRGASIVEMLFCTSLVALVGVADQEGFNSRQLQIINTKVQATFLSLYLCNKPSSIFTDISITETIDYL